MPISEGDSGMIHYPFWSLMIAIAATNAIFHALKKEWSAMNGWGSAAMADVFVLFHLPWPGP
jgi:hypothetical protein